MKGLLRLMHSQDEEHVEKKNAWLGVAVMVGDVETICRISDICPSREEVAERIQEI
jgi:hypothetical protein